MSQVTTSPGPCASPSCAVTGTAYMEYWAPKGFTVTTTGTITVLKIINTISNTTRYSTKYADDQIPPGFTPPPTNSAGTRISPLTYTLSGTTRTTTLAYPTPHLHLPPTYHLTGSYPVFSSCVLNANLTIPIPYVQPPWSFSPASKWDLTPYLDPTDPLGWGFVWNDPGTRRGLAMGITEVLELFPDDDPELPHAVVRGCRGENLPQPYAVKAEEGWRVVGVEETVLEGGEETTGRGTGTGSVVGVGATGTAVGTGTGTVTGTAVVGGETGKSNAAGRGKELRWGVWGWIGVAVVLGRWL